MNDPVILKNSLGVAVLTLLQVVAPAIAAVVCLYAVDASFTVPYVGNINLLALLTFLLMLLMLPRQRRTTEARIFNRAIPLSAGVILRWLAVLAVLLVIGFTTKESQDFPRRVLLTWAVVTAPVLVLVTLVHDRMMHRALSDPANARRVVFAGINEVSVALAMQLKTSGHYGMVVEGYFDDRSVERLGMDSADVRLLGRLGDLATYVNSHRIHVIFVSLPMRHLQRVRDLLDDLRDTTASIYYLPDVFVFDLIQSRIGEISGMPVVALCETPFYGLRGVVKRVTDIVIAALALVLLSPFLVLVALAIRLTSHGRALFKQRRYGLDGHEIVVYKFRTMKVTEDQGPIVQAKRDDERITPIGRFLRRYSIDELPQLFNVLQGRMSLVGPRPHAVAHNEEYRKLIKGYMVRHKVQPGITGLAQVNGCRGETSKLEEMELRVKYDLDYLRNWSPMLDIKILFATVIKIFKDDRAY